MKLKGNVVYGQSGGPTSVINCSAYGVIKEAQKNSDLIGKIFAMENGIDGLINDNLLEINLKCDEDIELLKQTPGAAFGTVRFKLKSYEENEEDYKKIMAVLIKHDIRYVFYNGGNDSMDTCHKLDCYFKKIKYECRVIGIPKTIDNDLPFTDHTPGFGSAAKFIINSIAQLSFEMRCYPKGRINVVEIMGRDAGWLTASTIVALKKGYGPDLIYLPEVPFDVEQFKNDVKKVYERDKMCLVVVSEGIKDKNGKFILETSAKADSFGHIQLGGVATYLTSLFASDHIKTRAIEFSLLQRCSSHISSLTDMQEAENCGREGIRLAIKGESGVMVTMERELGEKYSISYQSCPLEKVANIVKEVPRSMINEAGNYINEELVDYLLPLIKGENSPLFEDGVIKLSAINCKKKHTNCEN